MTIPMWGDVLYLWKEFLTRILAQPKRIIFTGHTQLIEDNLTGTFIEQVNLQGQIKEQIAGLFSNVWRCYVVDDKEAGKTVPRYKIRTVQNSRFLDLKASTKIEPIIQNDWNELRELLNVEDEDPDMPALQ